MQQIDNTKQQPYAWTVPAALMLGIVLVLTWRLPIYTGLVIGYVWSAVYAKCHDHTWRGILHATLLGVQKLWLVYAVLLLVGGVVAMWMDSGKTPALVQAGSSLLHPNNLLWMSFLLLSFPSFEPCIL